MLDRRYRQTAGFALVFAGVIVAVAGWLGVANETQVAFQLPYFASAGVGALMLLGFGAAMLLSAQLERDTDRVDELEEAVRQLAGEVSRLADELAPQRGRADVRVSPPAPAAPVVEETNGRARTAPRRASVR